MTSGYRHALCSFGLFADAHYAEKVHGDRHCRDSLDKLRACIDTFNERQLPMAVNLGDLIDTGPDREFELGYLAAMCEACAAFEGRKHIVVGNHDVETLTKTEFLNEVSFLDSDVANCLPYDSFDRDPIHFVILDGNCHQDGSDFDAGNFDWADTWISEAQLAWLAQDLAAARSQWTIVFCHENLDHRLRNGVLAPHVVRNAAAVRAILERAGNVLAVFQGHYHPGMCTTLGGIPYITLSAMVVGPGLENNAYAVLTVYADGALRVEGFGRQANFKMPGMRI